MSYTSRMAVYDLGALPFTMVSGMTPQQRMSCSRKSIRGQSPPVASLPTKLEKAMTSRRRPWHRRHSSTARCHRRQLDKKPSRLMTSWGR